MNFTVSNKSRLELNIGATSGAEELLILLLLQTLVKGGTVVLSTGDRSKMFDIPQHTVYDGSKQKIDGLLEFFE